MRRLWMCLLAALACAAVSTADTDDSSDKLGKKVEPALVDPAGKTISLADLRGEKATVVVFFSFDCPNSTGYASTLAELAKKYEPQGVSFVGICPCDDSPAEIEKHAKDFALPFPVYKDERFAAHYDEKSPGLAAYLRAAIHANADRGSR